MRYKVKSHQGGLHGFRWMSSSKGVTPWCEQPRSATVMGNRITVLADTWLKNTDLPREQQRAEWIGARYVPDQAQICVCSCCSHPLICHGRERVRQQNFSHFTWWIDMQYNAGSVAALCIYRLIKSECLYKNWVGKKVIHETSGV